MKSTLIIAMVLACCAVQAQNNKPEFPDNGVYLKDSDYVLHRITSGFSRGKRYKIIDNKRDYLIVKRDTTEQKFFLDEIWGYRKNGIDWRVCNGECYQVDYTGKVCIYEIPGNGVGEGTRTFYYFSSALSSPVHDITKKNLINVFHDNVPFANKIKQMPLTRSIFKRDKATGNFVFVKWL
ncbi:MAG TPA: hypothetical protein VHN59_17885 [Chitinophagaceae bacterium]|nr:hypothetical protein [Chitinophagaceae bacterium]